MYTDILRRLRDAIRGKRAEEFRTNNSFLLHDSSRTQVSFGKGFLNKDQSDNTGAPSFLPVPLSQIGIEWTALL